MESSQIAYTPTSASGVHSQIEQHFLSDVRKLDGHPSDCEVAFIVKSARDDMTPTDLHYYEEYMALAPDSAANINQSIAYVKYEAFLDNRRRQYESGDLQADCDNGMSIFNAFTDLFMEDAAAIAAVTGVCCITAALF